MKYKIFDLDNCISDDGWRIPRIDWRATNPDKRYDVYHQLAPFDMAKHLDVIRQVEGELIIFTARPLSIRASTEEWLRRRDLVPKVMIMRNPGDHRGSTMIKESMLSELHWYDVDVKDVTAAFDDREDIVKMYRSHSIDAHLLAIHDKCAYTAPTTKEMNLWPLSQPLSHP